MPILFPENPTVFQTYVNNGITWTWTGSRWEVTGGTSGTGNLQAITTNVVPNANVTLDLGTTNRRWRDLYLSGNSIILGGATLTSTGSAVNLPSGSTVGGGSIASGGDVATGGGPKITNLQVTDATWTVLDDTAVDTAGGYFVITGTNFVTGCLVYIGQTPATSVAFVSAITVRVTVPATAAGTYPVYLVNPDGGTAIRVPGLTFSANPAWQTASTLPDQYDNTAITLNLVATDATSYTITSGSLPPGLTLNANTGVISGTVTGITVDTTYTFTVRATDAQLQDSPRTFTVTITVSDPYFKLTTLLLTGNSGNTIVTDSSVNNFPITVVGDSRATNFHPYHTYWSAAFNGTATNGSPQVINAPANSNYLIGTGQFSIESWVYIASSASGGNGNSMHTIISQGNNNNNTSWALQIAKSTTPTIYFGYTGSGVTVSSTYLVPMLRWFHILVTRDSSNGERIFLDGRLVNYRTNTTNYSSVSSSQIQIGTSYDTNYPGAYGVESYGNTLNGFLSQLRVDIGGIPVEYQTTNTTVGANIFTPPTTNLTTTANTKLLTFRNYSLTDFSTINATLSRNGSTSIQRFNPFDLSDTSTNGSMYFDGTGDYLTVGSGASALNLNSDCSIELWFYPTSASSGGVLTSKYGGGTNQFFINSDTANKIYAEFLGSTYYAKTSSTSYVRYAWNHLLVTKSSTTAKMWLNGVYEGVWTVSSTNSSTNPIGIGSTSIGGSVFTGYLSNVKFSNVATETGTSNITVPNSPFTATANTQLLTLQNRQPHNNHSFQDSSSNNFLITRSGNTSQGTFSPFSQSGWSVYFNGYGLESSGLTAIGTADFSIEVFVYPTAYTYDGGVVGLHTNSTAYGPSIYLSTTGAIITGIRNGSGSLNLYTGSASQAPLNQWTFIAFTRSGGLLKTFVNGVEVNSVSNSTDCTSTLLSIGEQYQDYSPSGRTYTGYISNIRIVRGSNGYAGSVPTSPLSKIANTHLLCCNSYRWNWDQSDNNYSLVGDSGTPSVQAFSPFAPTAAYSPVVHGGSAYFDGTGDYLRVGSAADWAFLSNTTAKWTVEFWVYNTTSGSDVVLFDTGNATTSQVGFYIQKTSAEYVNVQIVYASAGNYIINGTSTITLKANAWNHVFISYDQSLASANLVFYINGTAAGTLNKTGNTPSSSNPVGALSVGTYGAGTGLFFSGYLSNIRISNVVRTPPSIVPTSPYTSDVNTRFLLNFTNDAIEDATGRNVIETVADARTTSAVAKWAGSHSMYFDGTGDYLAVPANVLHNQLYATTRSFTIEFWIYLLAYAGAGVAATIISTYGGGGGADGWRIETSPNSPATNIRWVSNGADTACNATIELNTWIHYAFTYNGTTVKVFKNGTLGNTATTSWTNNSGRMFIGTANAGLNFPLTAYMADIRITNAERYTANFTAPTAPPRLK